MYKNLLLSLFILPLVFNAFGQDNEVNKFIKYSITANIDSSEVHSFDQAHLIDFTKHESLSLSFYRGALWVRLEIENTGPAQTCVIYTNDLINRTYKIKRLDPSTNRVIQEEQERKIKYTDQRSYKTQQPNFNIQLAEGETAVFLIYSRSDGRVLIGDPYVVTLDDFLSMISYKNIENGIFCGAVLIILLINLFYWKNLKRLIYFKYSAFILFTCLLFLGLGGYFYDWIKNDHLVDHLILVVLKIWVLAWILFTSDLFQIKITSPMLSKAIQWILMLVLGSLTIYQFTFYSTSVQHLHIVENSLVPLWIVMIIIMVIKARKERLVETKYYLIAMGGFIICTLISMITMRTGNTPIHALTFIKIGTIFELSVFTYTVAHVLYKRENELSSVKAKILLIQQSFEADMAKLELASAQLKQDNEEMRSTLAKLENKQDQGNIDIISALKLVEMNAKSDEEWMLFKRKYESLNPSFLPNLITRFPDLTKSEIRLLVMYKLGFSQKEISRIIGIAPASVKKSKQRVRKKLKLRSNDSLSNFIAQL